MSLGLLGSRNPLSVIRVGQAYSVGGPNPDSLCIVAGPQTPRVEIYSISK